MKGYIIDCDYLIRVKDYQEQLPRPRKRLQDSDGTILPLITVECEV